MTKDQSKGEVICCLDSVISSDVFTTMAHHKSIYSIYRSVKTLSIAETKYNLKSVTDFTYKTSVNEIIKIILCTNKLHRLVLLNVNDFTFSFIQITRLHGSDQCCKGDTSSQWEKAKLPNYPTHHTHTTLAGFINPGRYPKNSFFG